MEEIRIKTTPSIQLQLYDQSLTVLRSQYQYKNNGRTAMLTNKSYFVIILILKAEYCKRTINVAITFDGKT